jgi:aconitate hydratase
MGVLPLELRDARVADLALDGSEVFDIEGIAQGLQPAALLKLCIHRTDGTVSDVRVTARIDTADELEQYRHGGILPQVYRQLTRPPLRAAS